MQVSNEQHRSRVQQSATAGTNQRRAVSLSAPNNVAR
jgi:hypothetical protein